MLNAQLSFHILVFVNSSPNIDELSILALKIKIIGIEEGCLLQGFEIMNDQGLGLPRDQSRAAQLLDAPIHVHGGEPDGGAQIDLRKRNNAGIAIRQANGAQPPKEFAKQMSDTLKGGPLTKADGPFPLDGCSHQSLTPECPCDLRIIGRDGFKGLSGQLGDSARS